MAIPPIKEASLLFNISIFHKHQALCIFSMYCLTSYNTAIRNSNWQKQAPFLTF